MFLYNFLLRELEFQSPSLIVVIIEKKKNGVAILDKRNFSLFLGATSNFVFEGGNFVFV